MKWAAPLGKHILIKKMRWIFNWLSANFYQTEKKKNKPMPAASDFHLKSQYFQSLSFSMMWPWEKLFLHWHKITEKESDFPYPSSRAHPTCFKLNPKPSKDYTITHISKHSFLPDQTWTVGLMSPHKGLKIRHASLS